MKNVLIFTILGVFFSLILLYILKDFSPFELSKVDELIKSQSYAPGEWEKLNINLKSILDSGLIFQYLSTSAYIAFVSALASIFSFFCAIHLFLDKLFFRGFYEKPSLYNAIRRSLLVILTIGLITYMKLSILGIETILLVPLVTLILEIIIVTTINPFFKKRLSRNIKQNSEDI